MSRPLASGRSPSGPEAAIRRTLRRLRAEPAAGPAPEAAPGIAAADVELAASCLRQALHPVTVSPWADVAWRSSLLTGTGFPLEAAWASRDTALRWTCEVAGPELPEAARLARAVEAAELVGAPGTIEAQPWAAAQQGRALRWGAWLGLRVAAGTVRTKVYVELPDGCAPGPWAPAAAGLRAVVPDLVWRMAGCNDDGTVELYARIPAATPATVGEAARLVGDDGALAAAVASLARVRGSDAPLPRPSGLSLLVSAAGTPVAVTWFVVASSVLADDAAVVATLVRAAESYGAAPASVTLYRTLASGADDGRRRHGMVGAGIDRLGTRWVQAGVRPT